MELSSNLAGKLPEEIEMMAANIAANHFVKSGNQAPSFHNCNELRCLVGGRYQSFPELSAFVVETYNKVLSSLILKNQ